MTTGHDSDTRVVLSWLREDSHENAERVLLRILDEVDATPQRRSWWPAWRTNRMNTYAKLIAAAATVLVVAIVGYQFLPGNGGVGAQPTIGPSPTPTLLARGTFGAKGGTVEIDATGIGDGVSGTMNVTQGTDAFTVDLKCAQIAEDGRILIGGDTTSSTAPYATKGKRTGIVLKPGSPVTVVFDFEFGSAATCLEYLDSFIRETFATEVGPDGLEPIEGTVELRP